MGELNREIFEEWGKRLEEKIESSDNRINDKLCSIDGRIGKVEKHIEKIEEQNNHQAERIVRIETKYEGIDQRFLDMKENLKQEIQKENSRQNLKIIGQAVGASVTLMALYRFIVGLIWTS